MREDWIVVELGELSTFELGGDWGKAPEYEDENYVEAYCIRGSEFRNWDNEKGVTSALRKIKKESLKKRNLKENDILVEISGGGPEQPVGRTVVIEKSVLQNFKGKNLICTNFLRLIRPTNFANSVYINLYLKYFYSTGKIIRYQAGSNNLRNLKFNDYLTIQIPIAPLPIQRAIVTKIENLFASLDKGIADLKTAQEQLKVYRQAVLKKAFEGELTREWREKAVKTDGRSSQKETTIAIAAESIIPYNNQVKKKLPEGWKWLKMGEVIEKPKYGTSKKCTYKKRGYGVLRIPNIINGYVNSSDLKYANFSKEEIETYSLNKGDILTIRSNGSINIVGKCAIIREKDTRYLHAGYLIRLRPLKQLISSEFLLHLLSSFDLRVQIELKAKSTSGVNNINSEEIQSLDLPYPSIAEQHQIVREIESRLSVCDKVEQSISEALGKAQALRQSILKKAFEGRLLSDAEIEQCKQEADYEPASVLLEKIKKSKMINYG